MATIKSTYELDLEDAIAGFKAMHRQVEDFNKTVRESKHIGDDTYKSFAHSTGEYNKSLAESVRNNERVNSATKSVKEELKRVDVVFSELAQSQKGFTSAGKYDEVKRKLEEVRKKQAELRGEIDNTGKSTSMLGGIAGKVAGAIGGLFVLDKALEFGKKIFDVTAEFQKYQAVLTNTLGSSKLAAEAMDMLRDIAAKTPFSVAELTASYVKLRNTGINPTREDIIALGDVASSQGKFFDQFSEAIIDAQTGSFERLKEFTIGASKQGDMVAFSFKGQTTEVKNNAEAIKEYLVGLGKLEGVAGGMAAQSATLGGQLSNLGDAFDNLFLAIGSGSSGIFSSFISGISSAVSGLADLISGADNSVKVFKEQKSTVDDLQQNLVPLISRYEELKGKTSLSADEQTELNSIIQQIGKTVPQAITGFDEYGKALDISTGKAKDFIRQQQLLAQNMNKEAIAEQKEELKALDVEITKILTTLRKGSITQSIGPGMAQEFKLSGEEIAKLQSRLAELQAQKVDKGLLIDGLKGIKAEATGTAGAVVKTAEAQKGLIESLQATIAGLQDQQKKATSLIDIKDDKGNVTKGVRTLGVEIEKAQKELDSLLSKNAKKTSDERKKQLEELSKIEQDLEKQAAKARLDALDKDSREYLDELFNQGEKEIDLIEQKLLAQGKLTNANFKLSTEQEVQIQILRETNAKNYIDSIDDLTKRQSEVYKKQNEERIKLAQESIDIEERLTIERVKAVRDISVVNENDPKSVKNAEDFERTKQQKILAIQIEFRAKQLELIKNTSGAENELRKAELENQIRDLTEQLGALTPKQEKKFDIFSLLGLDLDDKEKEGVIAAVSEITGAVQASIQAQIEASSSLIAQKDRELEQRKRSLDQQIELNKQGFASDVEGERARIREIEKERNAAIQRQRQAQRAQLIMDTITQASSLLTASANILKATSPILPPLGQILGIAAIATMVGGFIAAKAKAFQATSGGPSFRKGGGLMLEGASHEKGGIHLTDSKTGKKLAEYEGDEYLFAVNKSSTKKYLPFIEAINKNDFSHLTVSHLSPILDEMKIKPTLEVARKITKLQTKTVTKEVERQKEFHADLKENNELLKRIADGTDCIPRKRITYLPDGGRIEEGPNFRRKIRKIA